MIERVQPFVDAYPVLGVPPDASPAQLKRAHRALVRQHHPDLVPPTDRAEATRRVQDYNVAYGLVRNPATRERYDRLRALQLKRTHIAEVDAAAAAQWESAVVAAGRWAGGWWSSNADRLRCAATPARAGAARTQRRAKGVARDALGRVLWLVSCVAGGMVGLLAALAIERLAGLSNPLVALAGTIAGIAIGHRRGWRRRLRLAGHPASATRWVNLIEVGAWCLVVAAAVALAAAVR